MVGEFELGRVCVVNLSECRTATEDTITVGRDPMFLRAVVMICASIIFVRRGEGDTGFRVEREGESRYHL